MNNIDSTTVIAFGLGWWSYNPQQQRNAVSALGVTPVGQNSTVKGYLASIQCHEESGVPNVSPGMIYR